jgi:hypothetical protein
LYLNDNNYLNQYPVWIEGIGSLAGLLKPGYTPTLQDWEWGELNCFYHNDTLVYQSYLASLFGCMFENSAPVLDEAFVIPDTVTLTQQITIVVYAYDLTDNSIKVSVVAKAPNGESFTWSYFQQHYYYGYYYKNTSNFHDITGQWYLSQIILEDYDNNITIINLDSNNTSTRFYVKNQVNINSLNNEFKIYPNPVTDILNIDFVKNTPETEIIIRNMLGDVVFQKYYDNSEIDISNFPKGVYILTIKTNNKTYSEKFLKL